MGGDAMKSSPLVVPKKKLCLSVLRLRLFFKLKFGSLLSSSSFENPWGHLFITPPFPRPPYPPSPAFGGVNGAFDSRRIQPPRPCGSFPSWAIWAPFSASAFSHSQSVRLSITTMPVQSPVLLTGSPIFSERALLPLRIGRRAHGLCSQDPNPLNLRRHCDSDPPRPL